MFAMYGTINNLIQMSPLQEPVQDEYDILKFCEESGLPVALDETIDKSHENPLETLVKFIHPGIVAVVSTLESPSDIME